MCPLYVVCNLTNFFLFADSKHYYYHGLVSAGCFKFTCHTWPCSQEAKPGRAAWASPFVNSPLSSSSLVTFHRCLSVVLLQYTQVASGSLSMDRTALAWRPEGRAALLRVPSSVAVGRLWSLMSIAADWALSLFHSSWWVVLRGKKMTSLVWCDAAQAQGWSAAHLQRACDPVGPVPTLLGLGPGRHECVMLASPRREARGLSRAFKRPVPLASRFSFFCCTMKSSRALCQRWRLFSLGFC